MNIVNVMVRLASALLSVVITAGIGLVFEFGHLA